MQVLQTNVFKQAVKKLHANQKVDLDKAIKVIMKTPLVGEEKLGGLLGIRIYKFKMVKQLTLLAYLIDKKKIILTLLALGSHENFYRDLKKSI